MDPTVLGGSLMRHNVNRALPILFVACLAFAESGVAQIDIQQRIASQNAVTGRGRTAAATHSSGLTQVPADFAQLKLASGFLLCTPLCLPLSYAEDRMIP